MKRQQQPTQASSRIDLLNIGLIVVSCLLAFRFPFKLFLLSYAVLGPLHYLTEIFWLRERNYFLKEKKDYRWLLVFTALMTLVACGAETDFISRNSFFQRYGNSVVSTILFTGFCCSIALTLLHRATHRLLLMAASGILAAVFFTQSYYLLIFGLLLATLLHVSLFTFLFMVQGAVKSKSLPGYISLGVYALCVVFLISAHIPASQYTFTEYVYNAYIKSNFHMVNMGIARYLSDSLPEPYPLLSAMSLRIQMFIAFAYTYHYLNWFSKAEVIQWNRVPMRARTITVVVWLIAVFLYLVDYKVGLLALLFLSLTHVFLEFPLNVRTITSLIGFNRKS